MSSILRLLKLKDYITLTGTTLGLISLVCGFMGGRDFISLGFFLLSVTIGTDLLDGYVARKTGTVNQIGKELDSLNDSLTFGIAPALLTFQAFKTGTPYDYILLIGTVAFALGAILRLARFNISEDVGYTGIPTPLSCLLIILFFYANYFYAFALGGGGQSGLNHPFPGFSYYIIPIILILTAYCNITTHIHFGEKDKLIYVLFLIFAPFSPFFGIVGILNPNFIWAMSACIFFTGGFIVEMVYIIYGYTLKPPVKKEKKKS